MRTLLVALLSGALPLAGMAVGIDPGPSLLCGASGLLAVSAALGAAEWDRRP